MKKLSIIIALLFINSCIYTSYGDGYGTKNITKKSFREDLGKKNMQEMVSQNEPEFIVKNNNQTTLNYHYVDARAAIPAYIPMVSMFYSMFNGFHTKETYVYYDNYLKINYDKNGDFVDMKFDVSKKKSYKYFSALPKNPGHSGFVAPLNKKYYTGSMWTFRVGG
jgi:hypothetical protein